MTVGEARGCAAKKFQDKHLKDVWLNAELLLARALKKTREYLIAHPEKKLTANQLSRFLKLVNRRNKHEPIAYIIGKREFYGLDFGVNKNVLIPRPETEILVDSALALIIFKSHDHEKLLGEKTLIVDVGTGSGCIAITLAKELKNLKTQKHKNTGTDQKIIIPRIFAIDSSADALAIAKKNAKKHGVDKMITFKKTNLIKKSFNFQRSPWGGLENVIILANLPYLSYKEWKKLPPHIKKYEPRSALLGGKDGLKYYRALLRQLYKLYKLEEMSGADITCLLEINPWQKKLLAGAIKKIFPAALVEFVKDLSGLIRVCKIKISEQAIMTQIK